MNAKIIDSNNDSDVIRLTEDQRKRILLGLAELASGEIISNEKLEAEEDKWLNE